ncbi:laccase-5-like [Copidosoma floridanum]|uniref:laccase-5-like n=1 Tax=Copidosoma floridanum TaxID=29053 RepID=UPI0006C9A40F|nr:laccase-5-like [Copidosoma floridanum]
MDITPRSIKNSTSFFWILPHTVQPRASLIATEIDSPSSKLQPPGPDANINDMIDWSKHPCRRDCVPGLHLTCRYGFTIENYVTMNRACYDCPYNKTDCFRPHCIPGDGEVKIIILANRLLPGPMIEVCQGDRIIVDVENGLSSQTTSIHWHGVTQRGTPFMDGVPFISQCPILPGRTFRYDFRVPDAGTFIWHSHSGDQRADGLLGGFVVREPRSMDKMSRLYDVDEHVVVINDWARGSGLASYILEYQNNIVAAPHAILVNGFGRFNGSDKSKLLPRAVFEVEQGKRYRFRLANLGSLNCPVLLSIDRHPMLVISTDGSNIQPVEVDTIRSLPGERYDFVIEANQEIDNYAMFFLGTVECLKYQTYQVAILHYKGAPDHELTNEPTPGATLSAESSGISNNRELNPFDMGTETPGAYSVATLYSAEPDDDSVLRDPDYKFYITYDLYEIDNLYHHRTDLYGYYQVRKEHRKRTFQLNHITLKIPSHPLQTQYDRVTQSDDKSSAFCNSSTVSDDCHFKFCECIHVLQVKLGSVVEVVIIDEGVLNITHPMHLHGSHFRVVAMEKMGDTVTLEQVKERDRAGTIQRKLSGAPCKDTVGIPSGGYTIVRFLANNPGYWFFHCHYETHQSSGMALIFKIGEHEDFPKVPKNFPRC